MIKTHVNEGGIDSMCRDIYACAVYQHQFGFLFSYYKPKHSCIENDNQPRTSAEGLMVGVYNRTMETPQALAAAAAASIGYEHVNSS